MSGKDLRSQLGRARLGIASLAGILAMQSVMAADGGALPIKKISVDSSKQLVVEFEGGFPTAPNVLDLPGPNHRIVLDFSDAALDKQSLPSAEELTNTLSQALPYVKSVRYSDLDSSAKPTARIVLDLPEETKVKPHVVKLEAGSVTIALTEGAEGAPVAAAPTLTETTAAAPAATEAGGAASPSWEWSAGNSSTPASTTTPVSTAGQSEPLLKPALAVAGADATTVASEAAPAAPEATAAPAETPAVTSEAPAPVEAAPVTSEAPTPEPTPSATTETPAPVAPTGDKKLSAVKHYNSAVQFHLSGKLDEAIAAYKAALEDNNNLPEAHSNLGLIYNQQHNYAQALSEFRKALALNPKDAITYNGIGAALRAEKDLLGAIKNWQTAVSLDPKLATAHYNLGTAYEIQKEYDKALASYNLAVKNDYRLGEAYYRMGLIMERKRRSQDAAEQFQEALKVSGDSEYSEDARQRLAYLQQNKKGKAH